MVKIGIIGCGKIAQIRHIPEYIQNPDAKIIGFYDLNRERAGKLAARYGAAAYDSVEELLADPGIDAVSVCTANHAHGPITIAALRAGKHVLCEKPMAVTEEECEQMVEEARKAGKFLMIGQNQRLARVHVKARELIRQGEIGKILTARTSFGHGGPESWSVDSGKGTWFFDKDKAVMGAMADLGIHKTDLLQYLCGGTIRRVTARTATLDKRYEDGTPISVEDNGFCIYEMDNHVFAYMNASWTCYGKEENSTVLYGTEGTLRICDDPAHSIVLIKKNGERYLYDVEPIQTNHSQSRSGVIDLWIDSLVRRKKPEISGESVLPAMRAVFGAMVSAREGRTVEVNQQEVRE
ncbi:MAG: Gfo/Idh/MocA family oxidoreductase [Eubacteriales bacterium]|nr:Gfo/Idh/MocA family oxidoreductase [Eubacteriales bacterium]